MDRTPIIRARHNTDHNVFEWWCWWCGDLHVSHPITGFHWAPCHIEGGPGIVYLFDGSTSDNFEIVEPLDRFGVPKFAHQPPIFPSDKSA